MVSNRATVLSGVGIEALAYVTIPIGGPTTFVANTRGNLLSGIEGEGFIVESVDYPCSIAVVNAIGFGGTYQARAGLIVREPFRGLSIAAGNPPMGSAPTNCGIRIIVFKTREAMLTFVHSRPTLQNHWGAWVRQVNTAVSQVWLIDVPPGARTVERMSFSHVATTVTSATATFGQSLDAGPPATFATINYSGAYVDPRSGIAYGSAYGLGALGQPAIAMGAGLFQTTFVCPIPVPTFCNVIQIAAVGTGFTGAQDCPCVVFE